MVDKRITQALTEVDLLDEDQEHRFTQVLLEVDHDEDLVPESEGGWRIPWLERVGAL